MIENVDFFFCHPLCANTSVAADDQHSGRRTAPEASHAVAAIVAVSVVIAVFVAVLHAILLAVLLAILLAVLRAFLVGAGVGQSFFFCRVSGYSIHVVYFSTALGLRGHILPP